VASKKDATIARAHEYAAAGQFAKAVATWRELLDGSPTDANVYNTVGDLCLKNKMTADAVEAYSKAARFFLQEGFHLKAIALYKKILKLNPDRADLCTMLGDLNVVRGLMNNAIADYLAGAKVYIQKGHNTNALTLFRKIMKVDPRNMDIRLRVAELCRKEKLPDGAIAEYLTVGEEYERLGRTNEARALYEQILTLSPSHAEASRRLGTPSQPAAEAAEVAEATEFAATAETAEASLAPEVETPEALAPEVETPERAVEAPVGPIEVSEPEREPVAPLVDVSETEGEDADLDEILAEGFQEEKEPAEVALSQDADDVFDATFEEFCRGIKEQTDDEDCETHYDLGIAYKEIGLAKEAIEEFQFAARRPARFVDACTMVAACYADQHHAPSAIAFLEEALVDPRCSGPGVPYVKYNLAVLYEEEGMAERAAQLYAEIPSIQDVEERLRRLQNGEEPAEHI
jgi:tetratricopeptide (TPR) repeat protein